jgi:flagellin
MPSSINTNVAAYYAQSNISEATRASSSDVARLSSGNRIVQASDDVAALATGTSLATQVSALRTAQTNAAQGNSLLQVADGALAQIQAILLQQKSIALQAGSGALTDTDRGFLNQQFQALANQIDNLTTSTTFNGVGLIDGSLTQRVSVVSNTSNATRASMSVTFSGSGVAGQTFIIGTGAGAITLTSAATPANQEQFQAGTDTQSSLDNLVNFLNGLSNSTLPQGSLTNDEKSILTSATYQRQGNNMVITARPGGDLSRFVINDTASGTFTNTANGIGAEVISAVTTIGVGSIDADATTLAGAKFGAAAINFDAITVATVASGDSLRTIANKINANTATTGVSAFITGFSGAYALNLRSSDRTATGAVTNAGSAGITLPAAVTDTNNVQFLGGGGTTGLGIGSVIGFGSTGGATSMLTDQTQNKASSVISFPAIADGDLLNTTNFGTARTITIGSAGFTTQFNFTSTSATSTALTEIAVADTLEHTLDNAVAAINNYYGTSDQNFQFNQIVARREGNTVVIESRIAGDALDEVGTGVGVAASLMTGGSVSNASLASTSNGGIDTTGVTNANFIGTISGFTATYVSTNTVNVSVTIGGALYSASNVATAPTSSGEIIRMISSNGDYFDLNLRANQGSTVSSQADANNYAARLNTAVSGVTFYQNRDITSFTAEGQLLGSSVKFQSDSFDNVRIANINVTPPTGSNPNGSISFTVLNADGTTDIYSALIPIGDQLGAYSVTNFVSASDANKFITLSTGPTALLFDNAEDAATLQQNLRTAFGVGEGDAALQFQLGTTAESTVSVAIDSARSTDLYGGRTLDVSTADTAAEAAAILDDAIRRLSAIRANVGALQTQFNFASAALQTSIQNQDAARGQLLDADIASTSTTYATNQVKIQAGISVLAQANQQLQQLLKLIG